MAIYPKQLFIVRRPTFHVSYRGPRPMHWPIYRSIHRAILGRVLVDTRSSIGRYIGQVSTNVSTDTPIGRYTWWLTESSPIFRRYFADTSPILHRYCTDASPTLNLHRVYWLISVDISVDTLVDTRPTLGRSINALVSVDISADTLDDTSVDRIKYRSLYRWIVSRITDSIGR